MTVEIVDTLFQVFGDCVCCLEVGVVQGGFLQNEKPGLDKVQPRGVRWCPVELNAGRSCGPEVPGSFVSAEVVPD